MRFLAFPSGEGGRRRSPARRLTDEVLLRADRHFLYPSLRSPARGCGNPFLLYCPSPANLRICTYLAFPSGEDGRRRSPARRLTDEVLPRADRHLRHPPPRSPARGCGNPFPLHCPSPANLRICRVIDCAFYRFRNSAFFPCGKKAPRLAIHPSARRRFSVSSIHRRAGRRSARAPIEMFRSGNKGSVSDEISGNPIL